MKFTGQKYSYIHTKWGFIGSKHRASWCRNKESGGVGEVKKKKEKKETRSHGEETQGIIGQKPRELWVRNTKNYG